MSVTILEALQSAQHNLRANGNAISHAIGRDQLNNAVELLTKGYALDDIVDDLLEEHGSVDNVPEKEIVD